MNNEENEMPKDIFMEMEKMICHCKLDLPLSLCFTAIRENEALMCRLLKQGVNPNVS